MTTEPKPNFDIELRAALPCERQRAATLAVAAFQQLQADLGGSDWAAMAESIRATTALEGGGELVLALRGASIAGSVIYCRPGSVRHPLFPADWAYFRALAVPPESRGLDLGRRLAEACLTRAKGDGALVFGLHTADEMPAARRIYAGLGFRVTAEAPPYFGLRYRVYRLDL